MKLGNRRTCRVIVAAAGLLIGCTPSAPSTTEPASRGEGTVAHGSSVPVVSVASAMVRTAPPEEREKEPPPVDLKSYPWHGDETLETLSMHDDLLRRVSPPEGFDRVDVEPGSFGAWLRRLPLAAPGTPVVSYRKAPILPASHPNLAAVATIDVGTADLQQCADAVMRLHAEWKWSQGKRDMSYRAASGTPMPYARWERGERVVMRGQSIGWVQQGAATQNDHASFRKYLDAVFAWSNTVALAKEAKPVDVDSIRPGDFMILPGNPGHTVLILDMAKDASGRRIVLLGQSYMPAQSFHVLRPGSGRVWFEVDPASAGIKTPFWPSPFPWSSLRRLE